MEPVKYVDEAIADGIAVLDRMFLVAVVVDIVPVDVSMLIEIDTFVVDIVAVVVAVDAVEGLAVVVVVVELVPYCCVEYWCSR